MRADLSRVNVTIQYSFCPLSTFMYIKMCIVIFLDNFCREMDMEFLLSREIFIEIINCVNG